MSYVDPNTVKLMTEIAESLPPELQEELLMLVSAWKVDNRKAKRWHFVEILAFSTEKATYEGHIRNISSTGIFIETNSHFEIGEHVHLILSFIIDPKKPLELFGQVSRLTHDGIGVKFNLSVVNTNRLEHLLSTRVRK